MDEQSVTQNYAWLLPTLEVYDDGASLVLRDTVRQARFTRYRSDLLHALQLIDGSRTVDELLQLGPLMGSLLAELVDHDWLVQLSQPLASVASDEDARSRQLSYFAHIQRFQPDRAFAELAAKRVLIIGTGGIGCHLAINLAGSGVKKFVLSDPDTVSPSNLNRQVYFTRKDVGVLKVEALKRALLERFCGMEIETSTVDHDTSEDASLPDCDAVVVCGERESIWKRPQLVAGVPLLMAGYFGGASVVGPCLLPGVRPTWTELMQGRASGLAARPAVHRVSRRAAWNSSGAAINCATAGLLLEATVRMLAPSLGGAILVHERMEMDMRTLVSSRVRFTCASLESARRGLEASTSALSGAAE
jgi:molybdopterin-synthase adenylyltransferase